MDTQVTFGILAGCVALAAVLVLLSLHILRREPKDLRERSKNGEILLLTFAQIMALYNAAPEKWEMQVDSPTYYPHGKERDGLLVFMLPKERKRYRKWFDWRLSHGEDAGRFQMTAKALLSGMLGGKVAVEHQEPPAPVAVVVPAEEPAPSPQEAQEAEKPQ